MTKRPAHSGRRRRAGDPPLPQDQPRRQGYDVVEAETGAAAIELAAKEKPDLVVLDLGLPDMDGLEVHAAASGSTSLVPIIVLSVAQ